MRDVLIALVVLQVLVPLGASAIEGKVLVELNTVEISEDRCRLNFVIENKFEQALDSMKLDLVVFSADGGIMRRFITSSRSLSRSRSNRRCLSDARRLASNASSVVSATSVERPS
jgi:hypothetical protein